MTGEFNVDGVFVPAYLAWAAVALVVSLPLRWVLARIGAYRLVWHRGLFDIALVVLLWAAVSAGATGLHLSA